MKPQPRIERLPRLKIPVDGYPVGQPRFKVHWRERVYVDGRVKSVRKCATYYTREEAQAKALEMVRAPTPERQSVTMERLVSAFRDRELVHKKPATRQFYESIIEHHILPTFGGREIDSISPADIRELMLESQTKTSGTRKTPPGRNTANRIRKTLIRLYKYAGYLEWTTRNPAAVVPTIAHKSRPMNRLNLEEVGLLLNNSEEPVRTIIQFAYSTGLRHGEVMGLKWRDISSDRALVHVRQQWTNNAEGPLKTDSSRRSVPLFDEIISQLRLHRRRMEDMDRPAGDDDWVFPAYKAGLDAPWEPYKQWTLLTRFRAALSKAGFDPQAYRFHDLRSSFAVNAFASGMQPNEVQRLLGHDTPTMTARYAKLYREIADGEGYQKYADGMLPKLARIHAV